MSVQLVGMVKAEETKVEQLVEFLALQMCGLATDDVNGTCTRECECTPV